MENVKYELQNIILGDEQIGRSSQLKKTQTFLRRYAQAGQPTQKQQRFKIQETATLIAFAKQQSLFYVYPPSPADFISEGAEQKVYRFDDTPVLKTNQTVFYEYWRDYFNSILVHNYFFPETAYTQSSQKVVWMLGNNEE